VESISMKKIIFVVGAPRSGTTLLNSLICGNDLVYPMIPECTFMTSTIDLYGRILRYSDAERFRFYARNEDHLKEVFRPAIRGLLQNALDVLAENFGDKEYLAFKDPVLTLHIDLLSHFFCKDEYKIVSIIRNPFDVVASMLKVKRIDTADKASLVSIVNDLFNYYYLIEKNITSNSMIVRYEDIAQKNENTFSQLDAFLEFSISRDSYSNVMFSFDKNDPFYSENYGKPITNSAIDKGLKSLSVEQVEYIEEVMCGVNSRFGYSISIN
jgi:hypothetical protein